MLRIDIDDPKEENREWQYEENRINPLGEKIGTVKVLFQLEKK